MGALPKRRRSLAKAGIHNSHRAVTAPVLVECPQCHAKIMSHRTCPTCGTYQGRQVTEIKTKKKAAQ
jgi:large subunit ribosomal protein L32